jgi:hypothetical protein
MKTRHAILFAGLAVLSAACGPRAVVIESGLVETRVAATFAAIQATADSSQVESSSLPTATRRPAVTATAMVSGTLPPTPTRSVPPTSLDSQTPSSGLKPADSDTPAAGICASVPEAVVPINIVPGAMPDVRCMQVRPDQRLEFTNTTGDEVRLKLGRFEVTIAPGLRALLDAECGGYLAPGAHFVTVSQGAVPEIWLAAAGG